MKVTTNPVHWAFEAKIKLANSRGSILVPGEEVKLLLREPVLLMNVTWHTWFFLDTDHCDVAAVDGIRHAPAVLQFEVKVGLRVRRSGCRVYRLDLFPVYKRAVLAGHAALVAGSLGDSRTLGFLVEVGERVDAVRQAVTQPHYVIRPVESVCVSRFKRVETRHDWSVIVVIDTTR